ncbi:hypothetical protein COB47_0251 [Caldicellulosiruptor obsidiansis OB47]|uniref:Uncharacterized protein n=1 Tax=Caldicellulosiruptor obsidiansis (strain ATCC BAA-2073 / JCM 16842 / OB47) TaxID=608506 RepID=D9THX2_CALOO|nr:hypothetical protein [Caldicellulosiruptor obsidiansis]ADL41604.1 hypothetical protein COB47_0251 [Caldicellulosiruptor obsidiansis OB47]
MALKVIYLQDICEDYYKFIKNLYSSNNSDNRKYLFGREKYGNIFLVKIMENPYISESNFNNIIGISFLDIATLESKLYFFEDKIEKIIFVDDVNYILYCYRYITENKELKIVISEVNLRELSERNILEVPLISMDTFNDFLNIELYVEMLNHQYIAIFCYNTSGTSKNKIKIILADIIKNTYYTYIPKNCCGDYLLYTFSSMKQILLDNKNSYIFIKTGRISPDEKETLWDKNNIKHIVDSLETFILYPQDKFIQDMISQKLYFDTYLIDCSLRDSSFNFYHYTEGNYYFYTKYHFDTNKTELIRIDLRDLLKKSLFEISDIVYSIFRDKEGNFVLFNYSIEKYDFNLKKIVISNDFILSGEKQIVEIYISDDENLFLNYAIDLIFENFLNKYLITFSPFIDFDNPKYYRIKIYSTTTKKPIYDFQTKYPIYIGCAYGLINNPSNREESLLILC